MALPRAARRYFGAAASRQPPLEHVLPRQRPRVEVAADTGRGTGAARDLQRLPLYQRERHRDADARVRLKRRARPIVHVGGSAAVIRVIEGRPGSPAQTVADVALDGEHAILPPL